MDTNSAGSGIAPAEPANLLEILNRMHSHGDSGLIDGSLLKSLNETLHQGVKDATKFSDIEVEKSSIILDVALKAMRCRNDAEIAEALFLLEIYLDIEQFTQNVTSDSMISVISVLCILIKTTCNKDICNRALLCIQKEKCFKHIHADNVDELLAVMSVVIKQANLKSFTAQNECINIIKNILTRHHEKMCSAAEHWMHDLAPFVNHPAIRVRASTLSLIDSIRFISEPSKEIIKKAFLEELTLVIIPIMKDRFFKKQDTMMLILWCHICDILGTAIHQGTLLLNSLLEIVERGFKSTDVKIKVETFHTWRHLIDNFASVPDVICNSKRLQLLLRPMLANNAQAPVVAKLKFTIWWYLVCKLGPKLSAHFQMVCNPLILFCFTHELPLNATDVISEIGPIKFIGANHQFLHQLGSQAICQLLCGDMPEQPSYGIDLLNMPAATGAEFLMSYSDILLSAVEFITKDNTLPRAFTECIWKAIEHHLQYHSNKPEVVAIFNRLVQVVANVLNSCAVITSMELKIFGVALNILFDMPPPAAVVEPSKIKVLPVYILMKTLLNRQFLTFQDLDKSCYLNLLKKLLHIGAKSFLGALGCCSLMVKNLLKAAHYANDVVLLSQMWTEVCDLMLQYMSDKGDMNEGDSLGHDFTCCYEILLFPYRHIFSKDLPEKPKKQISQKCDHLYAQFLSSVALLENVGVNTCVEELFEKMFVLTIPKGHFAALHYLEELLLIIATMIKSVDWHQLSQISSPPARKSTKRHRFGNLITIFAETLFTLLQSFQNATTVIVSAGGNPTVEQKKMVNEVVRHSAFLVELIVTAAPIDILLGLLTNLSPAVELFLDIATSLKDIFDLNEKHVLFMWNGIISVLTRALDRNKPCPSVYFASIAPLVRAALPFSQEEMKKITFGLWKTIRSRSLFLIFIPPLIRNAFEEMEHAASPASTKLPLKNAIDKSKSPVKSKQNILENESSVEFVKMPAPKKTKIYTEHQLEQMRSKKFIPAMYSDLTQDSSSQKLTETTSTNNKIPLRVSGADDACDGIEDSQLLAKSIDSIRNKTPAANFSVSKDRVEIAVNHRKTYEPETTIDIVAHGDTLKSSDTSSLVPARNRNLRKNPKPSKRRSADNLSVGNVAPPLGNLVDPEATNGKLESSVASIPLTRSRSIPPNSAKEDAKWGNGILKKRKSTVSALKTSPKRRVVSFADSVDKVHSETNNIKNKSLKPRSTINEETDLGQMPDSQAASSHNPFFPKLVECNDPVSSIVSRLSPSMWTRGLNQFLKARNVVTVGDLSKMSSAEIEELPVKSPKLLVVRKVLSNYYKTWNTTVNDKDVDRLEEFPNEMAAVNVDPSKPCEEPTPHADPNIAENITETDTAAHFIVENNLQPQLPPVKKTFTKKHKRGAGTVGYRRLKTQKWTRHKGPTKQDPQARKPRMKKAFVNNATQTESCVTSLFAMSKEDMQALSRAQLTSMMLELHKISGNILNVLHEKDKRGE